MKIIKKLWVRVVTSIILGAIISSLYHYKTGHNSAQLGNMILFFAGSVIFILLSFFVWLTKAWSLLFPKDSKGDDILDN